MADLVPFKVTQVSRDSYSHLDPSSRIDFSDESLDLLSGEPTDYYMDENNNLVLGPIPESVETLTVKVNLRPSDDTSVLPDALYSEWRNAIAAGARLWVRDNYEKWVNDDESVKDSGIFEEAVSKANGQRNKGRSRLRYRTKANYF